MSGIKSLRERVAEAIRADGSDLCDRPWDELPPENKIGWLGDADRAIPVVLRAAATVADQRDLDSPDGYLIKRENVGSVIMGLFAGENFVDDDDQNPTTTEIISVINDLLPFAGCEHMSEADLLREKSLGNGSADIIMRARDVLDRLG